MTGITSIGAYIPMYRPDRQGPRQVKNPHLGLTHNLGGNAGMGVASCVVVGNERTK